MKARERPNTARAASTIPSQSGQATSDRTTTTTEIERDKRKKRCRLVTHFRTRAIQLRRSPCVDCCCYLGVLDIVALLIAFPLLVLLYYGIEAKVNGDPFLTTIVNTPLLYWKVSRQFAPSDRSFTINAGNSFVVNLPNNTERMKRFRELNGEHAAADQIQLALAHQWIPVPVPDTQESRLTHKHVLDMQSMYEQRYPYLLLMAHKGEYGSAGCSFSHIQVLEHFVDSKNSTKEDDEGGSYIFVFEDDAGFLEPFKSTGAVTAPQDADVVFLLDTSFLRVRVPYQGDTEGLFAIRVIHGWGSVAYAITKNGAKKVLSHMRRVEAEKDPIDMALINAPDLKVYHSSGNWPQVAHRPGREGSVRKQINIGNVRGTTTPP